MDFDQILDQDFVEYMSHKNKFWMQIWACHMRLPTGRLETRLSRTIVLNPYLVLAQAKVDQVNFKIKHNIPPQFSNEDIVPLLNRAWYLFYANVRTNPKGISQRERCPLNRNLLLQKEIVVENNSNIIEINQTTINL